nr:TonB-dependent receptor [uncultured Brevundimonas sp.]
MLWLPLVSLVAMGQGEAIKSTPPPNLAADQVAAKSLSDAVQLEDVEVRGRRGAAIVPPEIEVDGHEIDALGAWDIGEVLQRLGDTLALGEAPMVIINGKRVANASVFSGFPPDALVRAEVLPPEAGGLYGGAPGQRVVNLVLQRRFSSYDGRLMGSRPTQGGTFSLSGDLRRSAIAGENTHQMGFRVSHDAALNAADHVSGDDGLAEAASAQRPRVDSVAANATLTRLLGQWSSVFSLNGQTRSARSVVRSDEGLVENLRQSENLGGSAGFSRVMAGWMLQANLNGQASRSREDGIASTRSQNQSMGLSISAGRTLFDLPVGPVVGNASGNLLASRATTDREGDRSTTTFQAREVRGSLAIPLSKTGVGGKAGRLVGDLQATLGGGVREGSAGGGDEMNGAIAWTPRKGLRFNGVLSVSSDSVSDLQRLEPIYYGAPQVVFDFRNGEAVEILPLFGGNPDLVSPRTQRIALSALAGPFTSWGVSGNLGYQRVESTDGVGSLPDLTDDVEMAFPARFQRDGRGRLVSIDYRPLNLSSSVTEGLTTGVSFSLPRPSGEGANGTSVFRVALTHNLRLRNTVTLLEGLPALDRLEGDGGGVSTQDARIMLDARRGRWGLNASGRWVDGYRTRRNSSRDDAHDLVLKSFTAVDLKVSFQLISSSARSLAGGDDEVPRRRSAGLQVNLEIENLFDARPEARLADGSIAPGYGRNAQDPIGRLVRLTLQRRF